MNDGVEFDLTLNLDRYTDILESRRVTEDSGKVIQVVGPMMVGYLPGASVGSTCRICPTAGKETFLAEVVGFRDRQVILMPLGEMKGVGLGSRIVLERSNAVLKVGPELLGRVIDGVGEPLDNLGPIEGSDERSIYSSVINPLDREPIREISDLGVRAINSMITVGRGQRIGIMAGSGVGKSVLMGMMARSSNADVNVIAMIGERGREVKEFIEDVLGPEGLKRSIVVCSTSDRSPLMRMRGAYVATTIAEYFASQGKHVLMMMDSVTRFAMAAREIGLAAGEPPASKGYTPSVFAALPKLLERAGAFEHGGSITGLYTVLVEGDDMNDVIGDAVRSIVDGHFVLDRKLAAKGHFPAIDVLPSTSRVMRQIVPKEFMDLSRRMREIIATYREAEDLINIGAYRQGSNPKIDEALRLYPEIEKFLRQDVEDATSIEDCARRMVQIMGRGK
ncbi:MAG: FliI/YscN family ATPase [Bdellovibrionales bacterium]|jgi:flagellum-specific ATP synthase|nr:FliI/YscN family ATPase [Bdellovibrionales bacterium]